MSEVEAKEAGALFYVMPSELNIAEQVDPLLRGAVSAINESGWAYTAESCQGHPDETDIAAAWGHNVQPFIRMALRLLHLGPVSALLLRAGLEAEDARIMGPVRFTLHLRELRNRWVELIVYAEAHNVATRNRGCKALERFGVMLREGAHSPKIVQSSDLGDGK